MHESLRLPSQASSPRRARQFVDEVLHRWRRDAAIERTALIASELVTNAVVGAAKTAAVVVRIEQRDESVYLEVADGDGEVDLGLGLPIVEALATSWGIRHDDGGMRRAVWAEVRG